MGKQSREKALARDLRVRLREAVEKNPVYVPATESGKPVLRPIEIGGKTVMAAFAFQSLECCSGYATQFSEEGGPKLGIEAMPLAPYLGALLAHLEDEDIDVLVTDKWTYPLTTLGVDVMDSESSQEDWTGLLEKSRTDVRRRNFVIMQVLRKVLGFFSNDPLLFSNEAHAPMEEIIRLVAGKRGVLPGVDLGLIWILTSDDGPMFLRLPATETEPELLIGPLAFTTRLGAAYYKEVLPADVVAKIGEGARVTAIKAAQFIESMAEDFKEILPPTDPMPERPDLLVLDGGCLPLTTAGADFTEARIERPEGQEAPKITWATYARDNGEEQLRRHALMMAAREVNVRLVAPPEPEEAASTTPEQVSV